MGGAALLVRVQGYLAYTKPPHPWDPTVAPIPGDPMGVGFSYERGTPVDLGTALLVLEQDIQYKLSIRLRLNVF